MSTVAILTSGGDSPGMNAVVYSIALSASINNTKVLLVENGYQGLLDSKFKEANISELKDSIFNPGTVIGSSRCLVFQKQEEARKQAVENMRKANIDTLFVIGGNGSYIGAGLISNLGFNVIALPGTIDNDVASTDYTVGFFSSLNEIFHAIRKIKATANSHSQVTFLEVMGRDCCDLALFSSLCSNADYLITNKNAKTADELYEIVSEMKKNGTKGIVIVVSEKVYGENFGFNLPSLDVVAKEIESKINYPVRVNVLGYLQRGAYPTSFELFVAHGFGKYAFELFKNKKFSISVGFTGRDYYSTDLNIANKMEKKSNIDLINYLNKIYKYI